MTNARLPTTLIINVCLIIAVVGTTANAQPISGITSFLQVKIPTTLSKDGGYEHREALFGTPHYGQSMNQNLYYADSDLCDPTIDKDKGYPKRDRDDSTGQIKEWQSPYILMVDRGGCTFVQKVRNAQYVGAAAVVIADDKCLCTDKECINASGPSTACEMAEPIMANDGSGGDIAIPAMLMSKHDADSIKKEMIENNQNIQLQMGWTMPKPDDRVEYELWSVPSEHVSKDFQKNWKYIAPKFDKHIYFTPRQYIYDGVTMCRSEGANLCYNLCTNSGRYCALDPDEDLDSGISGADVVTESLRRICIWEQYGKDDGIGIKYWSYINEFLDKCDTPESFSKLDCVYGVFKSAKIDGDKINKCMSDSGGTIGNKENTLLNTEIKAQVERNVIFLPTFFVNEVALRGSTTSDNVMNAICAGFLDGTAPDICDKCSVCADKVECVKNDGVCSGSSGYSSGDDSGGISKRIFGFTLLTMCSMFGVIAYIHWKKTREDMRDEVRGILSEYMPLEDGDNEDGQSIIDFARVGGQ